MRSYAFHGSEEFNTRLDTVLASLTRDVEAALGDNLTALILGGGYGREEGGVEIRNGREYPYNDLDLTLVVRNVGTVPDAALDAISRKYARDIEIHVDFSRPLTIQAIRNWPPWLMWFDLLNGHMVLSGPQDVLTANAPEGVRSHPPAIEGLRLLLNRGAGLLWAMRVVRGTEAEPDRGFVIRNYYKLLLGLGDTVLISRNRFATPYRGRDELLAALADEDRAVADLQILALYRNALRFKFSPHELDGSVVDEDTLRQAVALWSATLLDTEALRTGRKWTSVESYAGDGFVRELTMNVPAEWPRNVVRNLRAKRLGLRHPRESLYRTMPLLLTAQDTGNRWAERSGRALALWNRYN